ncbi:hypothetical protein NO932_08675 [Pelagibacterium sp. 26DY04]|uniref:hypothetical protein n=1 Tax=Pelagibacterium sp. 26DY04 TaxID=2967130 RepID=UPI002814CC79|nr:hypothetical protein [Pelagibacterium sp. 26DY04]WMT88663.1 hypothetical protein NO932_08675 [Pelagibacterium sp. 26DY04]
MTAAPKPALTPTPPIPANDNQKWEWPAYSRLKAGRLMRTPDDNVQALCALVRLRRDMEATGGCASWTTESPDASINEDVQVGYGTDLKRERPTPEHLVALYIAGKLEYLPSRDGEVVPHKTDGNVSYQIEDRLRGPRGPAQPQYPAEVEAELNGRYSGAAWPSAPNAAKSARHLFSGAMMKPAGEVRTWHSPEHGLVNSIYAEKTLDYLQETLPSSLWNVLDLSVDGATAEVIGESRGHNGKYAQTVGAELQRLALEALIEAYGKYDSRCNAT